MFDFELFDNITTSIFDFLFLIFFVYLAIFGIKYVKEVCRQNLEIKALIQRKLQAQIVEINHSLNKIP